MNTEELLYTSDIESKISHSALPEKEKEKFLRFLSYFTSEELEELETMLA